MVDRPEFERWMEAARALSDGEDVLGHIGEVWDRIEAEETAG